MVLYAPPALTALGPVLDGLLGVVRNNNPQWRTQPGAVDPFAGWEACIEWFRSGRTSFERELGCSFGFPAGKSGGTSSLRGEGIGTSPLYFTMCWAHEDKDYVRLYRSLQAHLLLARIEELLQRDNQQPPDLLHWVPRYESDTENQHFRPDVRLPRAAATCVRDFAKPAMLSGLKKLEPNLSRAKFVGRWKPTTRDDRRDRTVNDVVNYCALRSSPHPHAGWGWAYGDFREPYHIYRKDRRGFDIDEFDAEDPSTDEFVQELIIDSLPDTRISTGNEENFEDWGKAQGAAGSPGGPGEWQNKATPGAGPRNDEDNRNGSEDQEPQPGEGDPGEPKRVEPGNFHLLLSGDGLGKGNEPGNSGTPRTKQFRLQIDRSLMPWSGVHLRSDELAASAPGAQSLQQFLIDTAAAPAGSIPRTQQIDAALIAIVLETGRSLGEAQALRKPNGSSRIAFGFRKGKDGAGFWSWPRAEADLSEEKYQFEHGAELFRPERVTMPAHRVTSQLLARVRGPVHGKDHRYFPELKDPAECRACARRIRERLQSFRANPNRITLSRISGMHRSQITWSAANDVTVASLALGAEDSRSNVDLHYLVLPVPRAQKLFRQTTELLWNIRQPETSVISDPEEELKSSKDFTGSRSCPSLEAVKGAVRKVRAAADFLARMDLRGELTGPGSEIRQTRFIATFNLAVLYLLWHQFFAIGHRGTRDPYIPTSVVSERNHCAAVTDKDDPYGYKTRLLWFPSELLSHMEWTEEKIEVVRSLRHLKSTPRAFFLDRDWKQIVICRQAIQEQSARFFRFPENTGRRIVRSWLSAHHIPIQTIDAFMGHWRWSQEPWGHFSTFCYPRYLDELKPRITQLLDTLGFRTPEPREAT